MSGTTGTYPESNWTLKNEKESFERNKLNFLIFLKLSSKLKQTQEYKFFFNLKLWEN